MIIRRLSRGGLPLWRRGFPFFLGEPRSAIERLRCVTAKTVWRQRPLWRGLALGIAMTLSWPVVTLVDSLKLAARRGRAGDRSGGPTFRVLYPAALMRNVPPEQNARYARVLRPEDSSLSDFLLSVDLRGLQQLSMAQGAVAQEIQDKARFGELCRAHEIPCIPTLAAFDRGQVVGADSLRVWTAPFFVKALTGNRGAGAQRWVPRDGSFASADGRELTIGEIIGQLRSQNCIVQPLIEDCAELKAVGSVALSSVRLVTVRGRTIPPTTIAATLNLASASGAIISNEGDLCGLDVEHGTITSVRSSRPGAGALHDHRLCGFALPYWRETVDLVCRTHADVFPKFVALGWDVAITEAGPVLIETNLNWGPSPHQVLTGPLGKTRLSDVIDELIAAPEQGRGRAFGYQL